MEAIQVHFSLLPPAPVPFHSKTFISVASSSSLMGPESHGTGLLCPHGQLPGGDGGVG